MTDSATHPAEDIAYVRRLAESGARAPLIGGRFMAWWGLLVAIAWTAQHLAVNGTIGDGRTIFGIIWGSFGLLGMAGQLVLARTMPPRAGEGSAGNRASRIVWGAGALAIVSMVIGVALLAQGPAGYAAFDWIVPVAFAVYACALICTGALACDDTAGPVYLTEGDGSTGIVQLALEIGEGEQASITIELNLEESLGRTANGYIFDPRVSIQEDPPANDP